MSMKILYVPYPTRQSAKETAEKLISKKLVACANILEITSLYSWEGSLADEPEFVLLAKTLPEKVDAAEKEIEGSHPYDVPCVLKIDGNANSKYIDWMKNELK